MCLGGGSGWPRQGSLVREVGYNFFASHAEMDIVMATDAGTAFPLSTAEPDSIHSPNSQTNTQLALHKTLPPGDYVLRIADDHYGGQIGGSQACFPFSFEFRAVPAGAPPTVVSVQPHPSVPLTRGVDLVLTIRFSEPPRGSVAEVVSGIYLGGVEAFVGGSLNAMEDRWASKRTSVQECFMGSLAESVEILWRWLRAGPAVVIDFDEGLRVDSSARTGLAMASTTTQNGTYQIWSLKDIRSHESSSGGQDEFESFCFTLEAEVTEIGWKSLYDAAVGHAGPIAAEDIQNAETLELSRNLSTFLAMKMRGKAQTMTKLTGAGNGFEALQQIYADYRPSGGTSEHCLLTTIAQPKWWTSDDRSRRSFAEVLHDWDHLVTQYELASHDAISDRRKCATILGYAPLPIRKVLDGASQEVRENYAVMRTRIREHCMERNAKAFVPRPPEATGGGGQAPMQVDAVGQVDAIGLDKPRCNLCKKLGHTAGRCWFEGKGGAKGDSKGGKGDGGKGGSKGGRGGDAPSSDKDKTCHYCKKKGHIKIKCFKFKKDQEDRKKDTASVVEKEAAEVNVMVVPSEGDSDECGFCMALESDYVDHDSDGHQVDFVDHDSDGHQVDYVDHGSNGHQVGYDGYESFGDQLEDEFARHACDDAIIMATGDGAKLKEYDVDDFLMLDGGADEHCARRTFARRSAVEPTSTKLIAAQKQKISLDGEAMVPFTMGGRVVCKANCKVGPFVRNLLGTGRVDDAGFDAVYSHNDGWYVGYSKPDGRYVKIPMVRRKNTFGAPASVHKDLEDAEEVVKETKRLLGRYPDQQSGIVAANEDAVMKDEGAVQADEAAAPVPMAESAGSASSGSGGGAPDAAPPAAASPPGGQPGPGAALRPVRDPEGAELGPGSRVDLLRQRLKELGAAIYGAKEQLWTRLKHAELKHKQDLDFKKAVEERYQQQVDGQPVTEAKVVEAPYAPTEVEKEQHEAAVHAVFKKWCPACVFGLGPEDPRIKQPVYGSNVREELIFFDWAFNGTKDTDNLCDEVDKGLGASLVAADRSAGLLYGNALGSKAADDHTVKQLMRFMKQLAYKKPELRCDTEPAVKALQDKVVNARSEENLETRVSQGRTRDSTSMGFVETRIRWWRGRLKANRVQVEMNYGIKLTPRSPPWPFLAHHAANVTNWYSRGADGYTAHFAVCGANYTGAVVPFAEAVMARVPVSKTGQRRSMGGLAPRLTKADAAWVNVIWVGKTTNNDERIILTIVGKVTCGTVRREKIAHMPRSLVMDGGRGEVAPTPLEAVGTEATRGRYEDPIVGAIEDISETLDYKALLAAKELTHWDSSGFPQEEAAEAPGKGLKLCDEFGICSVHPRATADSKKKVDTKWEKKDRAGVLKYGLVGREFAWLEERDDIFAPGSTSLTSRIIDFLSQKDDDNPDDPLVVALKDSDVVTEGRFEHLKRTRTKTDEGIFLQPHEKHALNIITELGLKGANPVKTPDLGSKEVLEHSTPLVDKQVARYRSCVGSGLYLVQDRTDIQRAVGMLASDLAAPTELSWKRLLRLGRYLVGTSDLGVFIPKVDMRIYERGVVHLRSFSDSDHGGKEAKLKSTTFGVLYADGAVLATLARRRDLIAVSSGESEFYALGTVAMSGKMLRDLLTWFGFRAGWTLETDSSAARAMSLSQGVGKVRHLDTRALWVQQATRMLGLKALKCKGTENLSGIGTKPHTSEVHEQLCKQVGLRRLNGDLGAVREVEVNAVIEKLGRTARGTQCGGRITSSPSLSTAILALCMALQAQRREGVQDGGGAGSTDSDNYDFRIVPVMLLLSWVFTFVLGFLAAI
ncbi:unnamed protein product [Prorocentrum cordatum]|uniref:CCHC-type domain-containing protein n=1 Tax=Prorocentrum cordatum TaxID=2364126 RepID=A0ABN9USC8_9DINO|nr:unnamed protein product [Polarella glacialis]